MNTPDYELLRHAELCLLLQSLFLNVLWAILFWGWVATYLKSREHPPDDPAASPLGRKVPGGFHWAVAGGVWLLTMGISLSEFEPVYWFLGFAIANGALLSILHPGFALAFTLSMLLVRPWEIMPENDLIKEIPRFSVAFSMAWAVFIFVVVDRFSLRFGEIRHGFKITLILLLYLVWVFASTFVTPSPDDARTAFNETLVRSLTLYLLIFHLARDKLSVWALKATLITIFTCVGLIAIVFYLSKYTDGGRIIAFGIFKNTNDIAAVMTMLLPLASGPWLRGKWLASSQWIERGLALIPIGTALAVLGLAQSRGAVLSIGAAAGAYGFKKIRRKGAAVVMLLVALGGGLLMTRVFNRDSGDLEGSSESRKSFWISGARMALYHPVLGVGFNEFPANFETYATKIVGEYGHRTAHSSWVLALAETGFAGLALFLSFYLIGALGGGNRLYEEDPTWLLAAVSYGVAISFLSHTYTVFPYVLVAVIAAAVNAGGGRSLRRGGN